MFGNISPGGHTHGGVGETSGCLQDYEDLHHLVQLLAVGFLSHQQHAVV